MQQLMINVHYSNESRAASIYSFCVSGENNAIKVCVIHLTQKHAQQDSRVNALRALFDDHISNIICS